MKAGEEVAGAAQALELALHSQVAMVAVDIALAEVWELRSQAAMVATADIALAEVSVQHSWVASVANELEPVEELKPGLRAARGEEVLVDIAQAGVSAQSS